MRKVRACARDALPRADRASRYDGSAVSTVDELDKLWARRFGAASPVAWTLRTRFCDRWVRFHSLPGGKRYPDGSAEQEQCLLRHNALLTGLIGPGQRAFVITAAYSGRADEARRTPELLRLHGDAEVWRVVAMHDPQDMEDAPSYLHLSASECVWQAGCLDPLLRLISDDQVADVMIVACHSGAVYHPYDGGADVITPSTAARDRLRQAHREWLSDHRGGL